MVQAEETESVHSITLPTIPVELKEGAGKDKVMTLCGICHSPDYIPMQPPLRDRRDAVGDLVDFFIRLHGRTMGKRLSGITTPALKALRAHHWPGNIRELQNVLERAVILARSEVTSAELPEIFQLASHGVLPAEGGLLKEAEHQVIIAALKATAGNRRLAADRLGISRRTLQYRLKEYGLPDEEHEG